MDFQPLMSRLGLSVNEQQTINPIVLSICIQVNHDITRKLQVRRYDDPFIVSSKFCKQYNLSPRQRDLIQKQIGNNLQIDQSEFLKVQKVRDQKKKSKENSIIRSSGVKTPLRTRPVRNISSSNLQKQRKIAARLQTQQAKQMDQCTFQPTINMVSNILAKQRQSNRFKDRSKLIEYIQRKQRQQLRQCTFKPQVNAKSRVLAIRDQSKQLNIFNHLYQKGIQKNKQKQSLQNYDQNCTFRPQINNFSYPQHKQCKFKHKAQQQNCSFNPKINRTISPYNPDKIQKWVYLQRRQIKQPIKKNKQEFRLSQRDQNLFNGLIQRLAKKMFYLLDSDKDGLISTSKISFQNIPTQVLAQSKNFLQQIQDLSITVDINIFISAFKQFFQRRNLLSRNVFLKLLKKQQKQTTSSKLVVSEQQRDKILIDKYQQGIRRQRKKIQNQIQNLSRLRMQQLKQCTFKPIISQPMWLNYQY